MSEQSGLRVCLPCTFSAEYKKASQLGIHKGGYAHGTIWWTEAPFELVAIDHDCLEIVMPWVEFKFSKVDSMVSHLFVWLPELSSLSRADLVMASQWIGQKNLYEAVTCYSDLQSDADRFISVVLSLLDKRLVNI